MDQIRAAQKAGVVIGLAGVGPDLPRLEIDEMIINQPDTFNLFCLAMKELKEAPTSDWMSFYQIAGIHGVPTASWDNVVPEFKARQIGSGEGYCPHGDPKFPTWHRPYIAMLEQSVYLKMHDIAAKFPASVKDTYLKAADAFRFPYWDWHRPRGGQVTLNGATYPYDFSAPRIFTETKIMVRQPSDNNPVPIDNPFAHFQFPKQGGMSASDFGIRKELSAVETKRYPGSSDTTNALSVVLNRNRESGIRNLLDMITVSGIGYDKFNAFGFIHGNYHFFIGGPKGHMSEVLFSAFDPIFWFHHCNIDRLFAVWQSVYPNSWMDREGGDLLPFRAPKGASSQYWTTATARKTQTFGYRYQDAQGQPSDLQKNFASSSSWAVRNSQGIYGKPPANMLPHKDKTDAAPVFQSQSILSSISKSVASIPNALLSTTGSGLTTNGNGHIDKESTNGNGHVGKPAPGQQASSEQKQIAMQRTLRNIGNGTSNGTSNGESSIRDETKVERQWYIDSVVERLALNGTFTIYYFVGGVPGNDVTPSRYCLHPTLAGVKHIFAAPVEACDNCGEHREAGQTESGTLPINPILLDHKIAGNLADLSPNSVQPFLVNNLRWRVVDRAMNVVDPRNVSGLQIGISSKATAIDSSGGVTVEEYPQVVQQIIEHSS
ncbi:hypothetical protein E8E14_002195 [Neopestalotiopsis sp. 37M]|nr:hypothetical protein E8E14_002195 [Neopestalotiopsis sp. 37M]